MTEEMNGPYSSRRWSVINPEDKKRRGIDPPPGCFNFYHAAPLMTPMATSAALNSLTSVTIAFACVEVEKPKGVLVVAAVVVTAVCADPDLCAMGVTP